MQSSAKVAASKTTGEASAADVQYVLEAREVGIDVMRRTEWLLTDGCGGYAMGTAAGLNTRRYHSLCTFATRAPLGRSLLVNAVHERLVMEHDSAVHDLSLHEFADGTVGPGLFESLLRFEKNVDSCRWTYRIRNFEITRELQLRYGEGGANITYRIQGPFEGERLRFEVRPLMRLSDHHKLRGAQSYHRSNSEIPAGVVVTGSSGEAALQSNEARFIDKPEMWYDFTYVEERARGMDHLEDLHSPGYFECSKVDDENTMKCTIHIGPRANSINENEHPPTRARHMERITQSLRSSLPKLVESYPALIAAADDFVVPRRVKDRHLKTILAGYPWFSDWGRDTCICLPGLLLTTGRHKEALDTLCAFAEHRRRGLIPNMFDDEGGAAHYNTVDASLWFCHAACAYVHASDDLAGYREHLHEACLDIIAHYQHGTDFNIHMDSQDGLIVAGDDTTQLTWMDAKRDGVTFTPRHGKAVEINALWYHTLRSVAAVSMSFDPENAKRLDDLAHYVGPNLRESFWYAEGGYLFDCLFPIESRDGQVEWQPSKQIRPNQLFAVSLEFGAFSTDQQRAIVSTCQCELLTPIGLRTLSPNDPEYHGRFEGRMFDRDGAYHQGTVWPWLIGPFVEATLRSEHGSDESIKRSQGILNRLLEPMAPPHPSVLHGPGATSVQSVEQLFEVYDGDDSPERMRMPGGCIAQAWSIAEPLRCLGLIEKLRSGALTM